VTPSDSYRASGTTDPQRADLPIGGARPTGWAGTGDRSGGQADLVGRHLELVERLVDDPPGGFRADAELLADLSEGSGSSVLQADAERHCVASAWAESIEEADDEVEVRAVHDELLGTGVAIGDETAERLVVGITDVGVASRWSVDIAASRCSAAPPFARNAARSSAGRSPGSRTRLPFWSNARPIDWRIQNAAYVENLNPLRQSNLSTACSRPMLPSWTRSPRSIPCGSG
jgi:hypothetical protein